MINMESALALRNSFRFKKFIVDQTNCSMKVGTDGVLLGAWTDLKEAEYALDIGTGTGVIAMMLAQRGDRLKEIYGVEMDVLSAKQAVKNMEYCPWADRLKVVSASVQEFSNRSSLTFDVIASNPPFFTGGVLSGNENRNRGRHTISLSHPDLLKSVRQLLLPEGRFSLILPVAEGLRFIESARKYELYLSRRTLLFPVVGKPPHRLLMEFLRMPGKEPLSDELTIRSADGGFTADYKDLTHEFYLNF